MQYWLKPFRILSLNNNDFLKHKSFPYSRVLKKTVQGRPIYQHSTILSSPLFSVHEALFLSLSRHLAR